MPNLSMQAFAAAQFAGQQLTADLEARRQDVEIKKQQVEEGKYNAVLRQQQAQQAQQQNAQMEKMIKDHDTELREKQVDSGELPDAQKEKELDTQIADFNFKGKVASIKDPKVGESWYKLAQAAEGQKATIAKKNLEIQEKSAKDAASYAGAVLEGTVSPQDAYKWAFDHMGAKIAGTMPAEQTAFTNWWKTVQKTGTSAEGQATRELRVAEDKQRTLDRAQSERNRMTIHYDNARALALQREQLSESKKSAAKPPTIKEFEGGQYEFDPEGAVKGEKLPGDPRWVKIAEPKLTSQQKTGVAKLTSAAGEVARSLTSFAAMDFTTRAGIFGDLGAHTPFQALAKVGTNKLTATQAQAMTVAGGGMGNQIGLAETAFGGRGPTGSQQQRLEDITTPKGGDTGYAAAYKLANGKEMMMTLLDNAPPSFRKSADAQRQRDALNKAVPWSTSDVIEQTRRDPAAKKEKKTLNQWAKDSIPIKDRLTEKASGEAPAKWEGPTPEQKALADSLLK